MAKKQQNKIIQDAQPRDEQAYVTWGDDLASKQEALRTSSQSLDEFTLVQRAEAGRFYRVDYGNLDGTTGGRPGLTRSDYDYFRPDEAVPKRIKDIIRRADEVYQKVGLVKNVIDLMGDFASQGIRLTHKNKRMERFYRQWFKKIKGKERSERFLNNLYRSGNVVIHRQTGKLSLKVSEQLHKATAADLQITDINNIPIEKREIPWRYTFIDPAFVEVSAGPLSSFVTDKRYELTLPAMLRRTINSPQNDAEKAIITQLPAQILEAAKTKKPYPLDPDKTLVYHYKKDDWQSWAYPMVYSIMDDIIIFLK